MALPPSQSLTTYTPPSFLDPRSPSTAIATTPSYRSHLLDFYLPHLYTIMRTFRLKRARAIQHLVYTTTSSSRDLSLYDPANTKTIFTSLVDHVLNYGHDSDLLANLLAQYLSNETDQDLAESGWSGPWLGGAHERTLRLFSVLAEISRLSKSLWLGSVLALYFVREAPNLLPLASENEILDWAEGVHLAYMETQEQGQCLRVLRSFRPWMWDLIVHGGRRRRGGRNVSRPRLLSRASSLDTLESLDLQRGLAPSYRSRGRWGRDEDTYPNDLILRDPSPSLLGSRRRSRSRFRNSRLARRSQSVSDLRRIENQVDLVLEAAEELQLETRDLRRVLAGRR